MSRNPLPRATVKQHLERATVNRRSNLKEGKPDSGCGIAPLSKPQRTHQAPWRYRIGAVSVTRRPSDADASGEAYEIYGPNQISADNHVDLFPLQELGLSLNSSDFDRASVDFNNQSPAAEMFTCLRCGREC